MKMLLMMKQRKSDPFDTSLTFRVVEEAATEQQALHCPVGNCGRKIASHVKFPLRPTGALLPDMKTALNPDNKGVIC